MLLCHPVRQTLGLQCCVAQRTTRCVSVQLRSACWVSTCNKHGALQTQSCRAHSATHKSHTNVRQFRQTKCRCSAKRSRLPQRRASHLDLQHGHFAPPVERTTRLPLLNTGQLDESPKTLLPTLTTDAAQTVAAPGPLTGCQQNGAVVAVCRHGCTDRHHTSAQQPCRSCVAAGARLMVRSIQPSHSAILQWRQGPECGCIAQSAATISRQFCSRICKGKGQSG